jgi:hypothetical protein
LRASFRARTLAQLSDVELERMLGENESLFVEHKQSLRKDETFTFARAVASFANHLGGWVILGVADDGSYTSLRDGGWVPPADAARLVDQVREVLQARVDPVPAFSAGVRRVPGSEAFVGIVRVYESGDTPHITLDNGGIYVRGVATDRRVDTPAPAGATSAERTRYRAQAISNQAQLLELARRGERALSEAQALLARRRTPYLARELAASSYVPDDWWFTDPTVALRAVPFTRVGFADWAVSDDARRRLEAAVDVLGQLGPHDTREFKAAVSGLRAYGAHSEPRLVLGELEPARSSHARAVTDAAGVLGLQLVWGRWEPPVAPTTVAVEQLVAIAIEPLLDAAVEILEGAGHHGRVLLELRLGSLADAFRVENPDPQGDPLHVETNLPLGGELTLPGAREAPAEETPSERDSLMEQWRDDIARSCGLLALRHVA